MTAALSAPLTWALPAAILLLALAMVLTLLRMLHGPTAQDRVLALDCMYLNGMLLVLMLGGTARWARRSRNRAARIKKMVEMGTVTATKTAINKVAKVGPVPEAK